MKKKLELKACPDSDKCELPILNPVELVGYVHQESGVHLKSVEKDNAPATFKRTRLTWIYSKNGTHLKRTPSQQLFRIFYKYARRASLNGLIFILKSRRPTVKALWSLLLLAAIGATTFHLIFLFSIFFEYQNYSKVTLKINSLQFPSVTVCNVNLLRFSQLPRASTSIQNLFNKKEKQEDPNFNITEDVSTSLEQSFNLTYNTSTSNIRNVNVTAILEASQLDIADPLLEKWVKERETLLCEYCKYCWNQVQTDNSSLYKVEDFFLYLFNKHTIQHRQSLSHQLENFVKMCSFAGRSCSYQLFKPIVSAQYGNCFTLDNSDFISRKSGAESGLELILSIENDDYLPGVTSGRGARVIIHEPGTSPHNEDNSITVSPGVHTVIGLTLREIQHIGAPYDNCEEGREFKKQYGFNYTRNFCQKQCEQTIIQQKCGCFEHELDFDKENKTNQLKQCNDETERRCLYRVKCELESDKDSCNCQTPCREVVYQKTISTLSWPTDTYIEYIRPQMCSAPKPPIICTSKNNKTEDFKRELIKLSIYFEDLNYEVLTDEPNYEIVNLLSDIGGSIGLWIGLSVLSLFEIVHLVLEIFRYVICLEWLKRGKREEGIKSSGSTGSLQFWRRGRGEEDSESSGSRGGLRWWGRRGKGYQMNSSTCSTVCVVDVQDGSDG